MKFMPKPILFLNFAHDMKKFLFVMIAAIAVLASCNDYETYGDMKEKERNAISKFIADSSITVISEDQFVKQGKTTNLERNEFVKLDKSGVYMQIVRQGCGEMIETANQSTSAADSVSTTLSATRSTCGTTLT